MNQRVASVGVLVALAVISLASWYHNRGALKAMTTSEVQTATDKVPRTPWGEPDLQGIWGSGYILTPLERPERFAAREFLTDEEVAAMVKGAFDRFDESAGGRARGARAGDTGTYNSVFTGAGREVIRTKRTSLIVDPADGKIPWRPDVKARVATEVDTRSSEWSRFREDDNVADGPEERKNDRCPGVSLPLRFGSAGAAGALHRIVQAPGQVTIYYEHGHHGGAYRSIALDGRPHLPEHIRQYLGDARGHFEGDTLVVDTTNFTQETNIEGSRENLHLIERFTHVAPDEIMYRVTIEDATVFTRSWTLEVPLIKQDEKTNRIFESACQEGNYALTSILVAARLQEKKGAAPKSKTAAPPRRGPSN
jgi:hypothetical protein